MNLGDVEKLGVYALSYLHSPPDTPSPPHLQLINAELMSTAAVVAVAFATSRYINGVARQKQVFRSNSSREQE